MHSARRLRAIALTLILALGGVAPVLDAVLFHSSPAAWRSASHIEQPGGCGDHAERCAVVASTATPHLVSRALAARIVRVDPPAIVAPLADPAPRARTRPPALHPRAPPAHLG